MPSISTLYSGVTYAGSFLPKRVQKTCQNLLTNVADTSQKVTRVYQYIKEKVVEEFANGDFSTKDIVIYLSIQTLIVYSLYQVNFAVSIIYSVAVAIFTPHPRDLDTPIGLHKHSKSAIINPALQIILSHKSLIIQAMRNLQKANAANQAQGFFGSDKDGRAYFALKAFEKILDDKKNPGKLAASSNTKEIYEWLKDCNGGHEISSLKEALELFLTERTDLAISEDAVVTDAHPYIFTLEINEEEELSNQVRNLLKDSHSSPSFFILNLKDSAKKNSVEACKAHAYQVKGASSEIKLEAEYECCLSKKPSYVLKSFTTIEEGSAVTYFRKKQQWYKITDLMIEPLYVTPVDELLAKYPINCLLYKRKK